MINGLFEQPNYLAAKKLLEATVARHEAIASNLANIETPGYKRMDVDPSFVSELQRAIAGKNPQQVAALTPHLAVDTTAIGNSQDGNTVQLENELAELQKNSLAHSLETQLITGTMLRLRLAITGRPA